MAKNNNYDYMMLIALTTDSFSSHSRVIDLLSETDDSLVVLEDSNEILLNNTKKKVKKKSPLKKISNIKGKSVGKIEKKKCQLTKKHSIGECPICRVALRKKSLASTKCGHVYCLKCLEEALKHNPSCPVCRCPIKKRDYHPIYLEFNQ